MKMPDRKVRAGVIGIACAVALVFASLHVDQLPFVTSTLAYQADFADAGGLLAGDDVEVAGVKVGRVDSIELRGDHVLVRFTVPPHIALGTTTSAQIKTITLLGRKELTVAPNGSGRLQPDATIPLTRTTSPYSLNDALGDLSTTVQDLDTDQLNKSLNTLSDALANTPAPLREALTGVSALSRSINQRDDALRSLLDKAQSVTKVLGDRSGQLNSLLVDGNQLLAELTARRNAISALIANIDAVSRQLTGLVNDNQAQLKPALTELDKVLALLQRNKKGLDASLDGLVGYATALGEQVGNGPYFGAYVQNWGVDDYLQMLIDAMLWPGHLGADVHHYLTDPPLSFLNPNGPVATPPPPPGGPKTPGGPTR